VVAAPDRARDRVAHAVLPVVRQDDRESRARRDEDAGAPDSGTATGTCTAESTPKNPLRFHVEREVARTRG
jgi:hypothetical protein